MSEENVQTGIVPTAAVLHFEARDRAAANADMGKSVAELLNLALMESGCADLVERAELDRALAELHLSAVTLTDKESQLKLGNLVGAKILITGSLFKSGDKNFIIAKLIGTETSRVFGTSVSGTDDFTVLVSRLAPKVTSLIEKNTTKLLPKMKSCVPVAEELKTAVKGNKRKVYVAIDEKLNASPRNSVAKAELIKLLLALGFEIVDTPEDAVFRIQGEVTASSAGTYQNFATALAQVNLSVYDGEKKLLAAGRTRTTVAGAAYLLAAEDAVIQSVLRLAEEQFACMK